MHPLSVYPTNNVRTLDHIIYTYYMIQGTHTYYNGLKSRATYGYTLAAQQTYIDNELACIREYGGSYYGDTNGV